MDLNKADPPWRRKSEKVQQHDEVVESSKTGCRSQSRAHEQVPALICDTYARRILCAATISVGGVILLIEGKISRPNILGTNLKFFT